MPNPNLTVEGILPKSEYINSSSTLTVGEPIEVFAYPDPDPTMPIYPTLTLPR